MNPLQERVCALESALSSIGEGVVVANRKGKFLFFNPVAERILGIGKLDVLPGKWTAAYGCYLPDKTTPYPPDQLPLARAVQGEEVDDEEIFISNAQRTSGVWINASSRPLRDQHGGLCGGVVAFRDVTAYKQSFKTISLLSSALEQTDDCVVITDRRGVIEYINPAVERKTGYMREEMLGQSPRILKSGQQDADFYRRLWSTIIAGEVFRGVFSNRKKDGSFYWVEQTITPMKDEKGRISHFVSVAKDVSEQREHREQEIQMRLAREVQQKFYPVTPALICGYDIAGQAYPASSTGGDYFDFIPMSEDSLGIAIGDVSGHGFDSALVMAETRAYLRAFAQTETDVKEILNHANRVLKADLETGRFVTVVLVRLDLFKRSFVYANAGHISGYLLDSAGRSKQVLESIGLPLGIFPGTQYSSSPVITLEPGDVLVLLTDGITEAKALDGMEFGAGRALEVVTSHRHLKARDIVEEMNRAVRAHMGEGPQLDDITCVICKVDAD